MSTERLIKAFSDAIPLGPHPNPHSEWVSVRLDFVQEAVDHLDWLERGNAEWRSEYRRTAKQAEAARATARIAIGHLDKVLNGCRSASEQQNADAAARNWIESIGI